MFTKALFTFFILLHSIVLAQESKLELGVGVGTLLYPDYIGSKSTNILTLPLPYLRYKGNYFRIDEDGINSKLFGIDGLRIDLSLNGSLPASSDTNGVRAGMPDLDLTGEIGPNLIYEIFHKQSATLEFEFPLRCVLSTDFQSLSYVGIITTPQLKYSLEYTKTEWTLRVGAIFSDKEYNNYFYGVPLKYATPNREAYSATSGFAGTKMRLGMTYKHNNWWAGAFISYFNLKGSTFTSSPLLETAEALYSGASIAYVFYTE